jgi:hypothetical protein
MYVVDNIRLSLLLGQYKKISGFITYDNVLGRVQTAICCDDKLKTDPLDVMCLWIFNEAVIANTN